MCSRWGHDTGGCWRGAQVCCGVASKRHMGVQHAALQYMADMWKLSSQPVVSDALRLGRASVVPQSATAWSQQRMQQHERVQGEFLDTPVDIRVDRLACFTLGCVGRHGIDHVTGRNTCSQAPCKRWLCLGRAAVQLDLSSVTYTAE